MLLLLLVVLLVFVVVSSVVCEAGSSDYGRVMAVSLEVDMVGLM